MPQPHWAGPTSCLLDLFPTISPTIRDVSATNRRLPLLPKPQLIQRKEEIKDSIHSHRHLCLSPCFPPLHRARGACDRNIAQVRSLSSLERLQPRRPEDFPEVLSVASAKDWDVCGHYDRPASPAAALAQDWLCVGLVTTSSAWALTARPIVKWWWGRGLWGVGGVQRRPLPWAIVATSLFRSVGRQHEAFVSIKD